MNILDLIVIAIIVSSGIRAYYRGFLYTAFQTLSVSSRQTASGSTEPMRRVSKATPNAT